MKLAAELAAAAEVQDFGTSVGNNVIDIVVLRLPCEDAAYDAELFRIIDKNFADRHGARSAANLIPLRTNLVKVNSYGSTRPWLASADEGSRSGTIKHEDPSGTQVLPKPDLITEIRGPGGVTAAALQIFSGHPSAPIQLHANYTADILRKACVNLEKFYELDDGEATAAWIDNSSLGVPGWAEAIVVSYNGIQEAKDRREANSLTGGCSTASHVRSLHPLVEKTKQGLNNVSPSEWVLIDVIADSGACETVMPKGLCANIKLRESEASKAGVEYEVASGKAVPNLGERHCEIFCEGAESSMMMHFQVADIHRPLSSLSRAADQGFRSYLDWYGGYLEDTRTHETIPIQRRGNLYVMQIWVRGSADQPPDPNSGFVRRG